MRDENTYFADLEDRRQVELARKEETRDAYIKRRAPELLSTDEGLEMVLVELNCASRLAKLLGPVVRCATGNVPACTEFEAGKLRKALLAEAQDLAGWEYDNPPRPLVSGGTLEVPAFLQLQAD